MDLSCRKRQLRQKKNILFITNGGIIACYFEIHTGSNPDHQTKVEFLYH